MGLSGMLIALMAPSGPPGLMGALLLESLIRDESFHISRCLSVCAGLNDAGSGSGCPAVGGDFEFFASR